MKTPVAFIIFNRPDTTKRVFEAIRQAKPPKLLIIADGSRTDRPGESEKCAIARAVIDGVDWECEVLKNYSDVNLGCKIRVSSGLDWVFSEVEEAIILEDDCLPHPSFFPFCEELLEKYRNDSRIMQICGSNLLKNQLNIDDSYYFSKYGPIWGWASWRRAWQYYDVDMKLWTEIRNEKFYLDFCLSKEEASRRLDIYDRLKAKKIDTWDYQWGFAKMINSGLSIIPNLNLISNIGFNENATHVTDKNSPLANLPVYSVKFPLKYPSFVLRNIRADKSYSQQAFPEKSIISSSISKLRSFQSIISGLKIDKR
ncbi:glycosyltransferase family 2 protein [Cronbergia sp. UHCC 0137]|uniref:glycosyltransferase family 2 protein n=1 Tax=Cronbergia sp. UHCC 0137 TaxID=3110239 RepID=UPI002B200D5E|nr:glycosyltransferase family 2 protein [Cronbergia sp. UHCC 0137]MEA5618346.1 glycosyltransferase family 2 protein [Cronbergia sp. UHCC 0137]